MFYVGLDIHSTRISIYAINETGQVVHRSQVRSVEEMLRALKGLSGKSRDRLAPVLTEGSSWMSDRSVLAPAPEPKKW